MAHRKVLLPENSRTVLTKSIEDVPDKTVQVVGASIASLSALCLGMALSWTSSAISLLQKPESQPKITDEEGSWIGSLITLGACLGAIPTGSLTALIGRKITLQALILPLILSWGMIAFSGSVVVLYAARFLAGISIGGISVATPMYVSELSHISIRGTLGTFFQVQVTIGLLIQYVLGATIEDFKLLALVSGIFPLFFIVFVSFLHESPVYLIEKNELERARKSLKSFRGTNYYLNDELQTISDDIRSANSQKPSLKDLFTSKATLRALIIALSLMAFQQLSGINAVLFYAGKIFSDTGSALSPNACAIIMGIVQVIATLLSTILIDKAGRKILLFFSALIMALCLSSLAGYFILKQHYDLGNWSIVPLASVGVFIIVFSMGFGPIPWMIMGELFPGNIRAIASSIAAALNWVLAFTVTNQFQNLIKTLGIGVTFAIFASICAVGAIFVAFVVPETKGKSVEEVQDLLQGQCKKVSFERQDSPCETTRI